MTDPSVTNSDPAIPAPPPDAENPAILDAGKTFFWTVIGAVAFCGAALFIIMRTRMGG